MGKRVEVVEGTQGRPGGEAASGRIQHVKNTGKNDATLSKVAYLRGLPRYVVKLVDEAYESGDIGSGVRIPRDTRPDGSARSFPEWVFRLLEASFAVEDRLEHDGARYRDIVAVLRKRRNDWLDIIGENE